MSGIIQTKLGSYTFQNFSLQDFWTEDSTQHCLKNGSLKLNMKIDTDIYRKKKKQQRIQKSFHLKWCMIKRLED